MLVAVLDYSDYIGRLAIGKVANGTAKINDNLVCVNEEGAALPLKISKLQVYQGISLKEVDYADPGDIIVLAGIDNVHIGDTICTQLAPKALKRVAVDEPTIAMVFASNTSPFSGLEGKFVQSAKLKERLFKETLRNVALKLEVSENADYFIVKGRGEFQMAILIETMRREGYEVSVGRPQVILNTKAIQSLNPSNIYLSIAMNALWESLPISFHSVREECLTL